MICEIDGAIVDTDINYALIADRNYKNKLKPGDLDHFTAEQVEAMKALAKKRHNELLEVSKIIKDTSR